MDFSAAAVAVSSNSFISQLPSDQELHGTDYEVTYIGPREPEPGYKEDKRTRFEAKFRGRPVWKDETDDAEIGDSLPERRQRSRRLNLDNNPW